MKHVLFVIALVALALSGCATVDTSTLPATEKLHVDVALLADCAPLGKVADNPQPSDVIDAKRSDSLAYGRCAANHHALAEIVKKQLNK